MSLWGNLKVEDIPDSLSVPPNTYFCLCMEAGEAEYDSQRQWRFKFVVMDDGSAYNERNIFHKYDLPDPNESDFKKLSKSEQFGVTNLKLHMARGFDMTPEQIRDPIPSEHMIGQYCYVTTVLGKGTGKNVGKTYTNVTDIVCERILQLENEDLDAVADSMGIGSSMDL